MKSIEQQYHKLMSTKISVAQVGDKFEGDFWRSEGDEQRHVLPYKPDSNAKSTLLPRRVNERDRANFLRG